MGRADQTEELPVNEKWSGVRSIPVAASPTRLVAWLFRSEVASSLGRPVARFNYTPTCPAVSSPRRLFAVRRRSQSGMTLIELIVAFTIMLILTTMVVPLARVKVRREKERELRYSLREIRSAIDRYKDASDRGMLGPPKLESEGYPPDLQTMVDGVKLQGTVDKKIRFLRRIPIDPMSRTADWGQRAMQDDPTSQSWGGQNVFDVYSKSMDTALDGTKYSEW